jgi:hypothetical protein
MSAILPRRSRPLLAAAGMLLLVPLAATAQGGPRDKPLSPGSPVTSVIVTKATVETKPWVQRAIKAGFLKQFEGLRRPEDADRALAGLARDELGAMPCYMAEQVALAVKRGLVLYQVLFAGEGSEGASQ